MKKYIIRIIGALCIIASLALTFLPGWVQIDGIKGRDIRAYRNELTTGLDSVRDWLVEGIEQDYVKDELRDNDLPHMKSSIKRRAKEVEALIDELVNEDITLKEVVWVALEAPGYIADTENFLDTRDVATQALDEIQKDYHKTIEEIVDTAKDFMFVFYAVVALLFTVCILGIVSAVTHAVNRGRFIKYIYMLVLLLLAVAVCVGMPVLSDFIQAEADLTHEMEDMALRTTVFPYIAVVLAIVPAVLDLIFERKKVEE